MINMIGEALDKHTDAELIAHMYGLMTGISKNYSIALEKGHSEVLWANLGDISLVTGMLKAMKKREEDRVANSQKP